MSGRGEGNMWTVAVSDFIS